jgi:hypothetical protein
MHLVYRSPVEPVDGHTLGLCLCKNSKVVDQLSPASGTLISTLHVLTHHSKRKLATVWLAYILVLLQNSFLASLSRASLLIRVNLKVLVTLLAHLLKGGFVCSLRVHKVVVLSVLLGLVFWALASHAASSHLKLNAIEVLSWLLDLVCSLNPSLC